MNTKALIRIFTLAIIVSTIFWGADAQALEATINTTGVGYTGASFVFDYAKADTGMWKTVLFVGKTIATVARLDSITGTHTDPDTIAEAAGSFEDGKSYYWYAELTDSSATTHTTIRLPAVGYYTFTTDDFVQNLTITTGYSTAQVIHDSAGYYVAPLDSIVFQYWATGDTTADTNTTVTHPDTVALTALEEGATYTGRMIAYLADSSIVDTSAEFSFTTTNLSSSVSQLRANLDSLILIIDSVDFCPDSLIIQYGNSALQLAQDSATAETVTTANCPDTITITGIIEGEDIFYQVLYFLPDSSAIDTGAVYHYTRLHNKFWENFNNINFWPPTMQHRYLWEFTGAGSDYSTGPIPITTPWIRIHGGVDGADDLSPGDSIAGYIWSWEAGDSTVIDTIMALDADTGTITPIIYMLYPDMLSDSGMTYYPLYDWGTHYSISFNCIDTTIYEDSTIGVRTVGMIIEEIK